jgi:hypothetical protein
MTAKNRRSAPRLLRVRPAGRGNFAIDAIAASEHLAKPQADEH